jgi:hypothetical protein
MARIILEDKDIREFEEKINSLPCFAKNVSENMAVSQSIQNLMNWMGTKVEQEEKAIEEANQ